MLGPAPARLLPPPQMGLGRRALGLVPAVVIARGAALLVPLTVTWSLGAGAAADTWFGALAVPTAVLVVVTNATTLGVTPALARSSHRSDLIRALQTAVAWGLALAAPAALVLTIVAPSAGVLALLLLPWTAFVAAAAVMRAACEVRGALQASALAPLARAATTLMLLAVVGARTNWFPLAWAAGAAVELAVLAIAVGPVLPGGNPTPVPGLGPLLAGESLVAGNLLVDRGFASTLGPGTLTLLEVADRVRAVPQTLVETTWLPVAFASWANLVAEPAAFAQAVGLGMRQVATLSAPVLGVLWIARFPLLDLLAWGALTSEAAAQAAQVFGAWLPGLWTLPLAALGVRANVLCGRRRAVAWLGAWAFAANTLGNAYLAPRFGAPGIAAASSLVWASVALWHAVLLRHTLARARPAAWLPVFAIGAASALAAWATGGWDAGEANLPLGVAIETGLLALALATTRSDR